MAGPTHLGAHSPSHHPAGHSPCRPSHHTARPFRPHAPAGTPHACPCCRQAPGHKADHPAALAPAHQAAERTLTELLQQQAPAQVRVPSPAARPPQSRPLPATTRAPAVPLLPPLLPLLLPADYDASDCHSVATGTASGPSVRPASARVRTATRTARTATGCGCSSGPGSRREIQLGNRTGYCRGAQCGALAGRQRDSGCGAGYGHGTGYCRGTDCGCGCGMVTGHGDCRDALQQLQQRRHLGAMTGTVRRPRLLPRMALRGRSRSAPGARAPSAPAGACAGPPASAACGAARPPASHAGAAAAPLPPRAGAWPCSSMSTMCVKMRPNDNKSHLSWQDISGRALQRRYKHRAEQA